MMFHCNEQAKLALDEGEVPVGCVVVDPVTNSVLFSGRNATNATKNVVFVVISLFSIHLLLLGRL